jgi:hypothetical protein
MPPNLGNVFAGIFGQPGAQARVNIQVGAGPDLSNILGGLMGGPNAGAGGPANLNSLMQNLSSIARNVEQTINIAT